MENALNTSNSSVLEHHKKPRFKADLLLILSLWVGSVPFVHPIGDFPLLDDWVFGAVVRRLLETGDYRPLGHELMTLVTNVLWGSIFCLPAGFSFTALRVSTLVASATGLMGVYCLTSELSLRRWTRALVTLAVGFNPIYYTLSNTFMTDVQFAAASVWTVVFLTSHLKRGKTSTLVAGTLLSVVATLSRELALCIGCAFFITVVTQGRRDIRTVIKASTPFLASVAAFCVFNYWVNASGRTHSLSDLTGWLLITLSNPIVRIRVIFSRTYVALVNIGIFLLPILIVTVKQKFRSSGHRASVGVAIGLIALASAAAVREHFGEGIKVPFYDNVIVSSGVGPTMLRDTFLLHLHNMKALPDSFWLIVTGVGLLTAVCLIAIAYICLPHIRPRQKYTEPAGCQNDGARFLALCVLTYFLLVLPGPLFFDRYLILPLPLVAVSIASSVAQLRDISVKVSRSVIMSAFVVVAIFAVFSVMTTRDYLMWNRVRWRALTELVQKDNVRPEEIDGGFEFNGTYLFDINYKENAIHSWWWVKSDKYQLGFGPVPGYRIIKTYRYYHLMPPHMQDVVVLRRDQAVGIANDN